VSDVARQAASATAAKWLTFLSTFDVRDVGGRQVAYRIRELVFGELYRRERTQAEWIDHGGEG
jgi:hypothetical protein